MLKRIEPILLAKPRFEPVDPIIIEHHWTQAGLDSSSTYPSCTRYIFKLYPELQWQFHNIPHIPPPFYRCFYRRSHPATTKITGGTSARAVPAACPDCATAKAAGPCVATWPRSVGGCRWGYWISTDSLSLSIYIYIYICIHIYILLYVYIYICSMIIYNRWNNMLRNMKYIATYNHNHTITHWLTGMHIQVYISNKNLISPSLSYTVNHIYIYISILIIPRRNW